MALDLSMMVEELGGAVIGPAGRLDEGVALAESNKLDGAILDVNLDGANTYFLADGLLAADVAVIFATGYDVKMLPERFALTPKLSKPFSAVTVEKALREAFSDRL
ncbi:response regulator [Methylocystis sp. B8]|uniref:response regulator n=1 Tax=Methylocystis sp. B8 TaxID=544938 RepID=UPI0014852E33|nr:response regulator [Methylocystis sp. B8]